MRPFAGFCLMLSRTGSALTFVRWLPVPYSRNSKKTALGIGLWRYAGIGIKPNDLPEDGEQALPPVAIGAPCPALRLR
jgi:hypothetical protein